MSNSFQNELEAPEMETLANLAENLVYRLPGCDDIMIRKTLQDVYRDFCRRSCCLRTTRQFTLGHKEDKVGISPAYCGVVDSVTEVKYNCRELVEGRDYKVLTNGKGKTIIFRDTLVPSPTVQKDYLPKIEVKFIEIPAMNTEKVPCWFIAHHGDTIQEGTMSRLHTMANKPWTDLQLAQIENVRYENAIGEERVRYYSNSDAGNFQKTIDCSDLI